MTFLNSLVLWGGLAAAGIAVPIIIHLLYRQHKRQTDWAAMDLLRRAMVVRSGQVRLEDLIILLLRCLALLLVALALLRPTFSGESGKWFGGQQQVGVVVAIDASYSMTHGQYESRFDRAGAKAREIFATLKPGDRTTLMLMGNAPHILLGGALYDGDLVASELKQSDRTFPQGLNLERNLEEIERLVTKAELKTPVRECYIITDAQKIDWESLSPGARGSIKRISQSARLFFVPVASGGQTNVAVTDLRYVSGSLRLGEVARFEADVRNNGTAAVPDAKEIRFRCGDEVSTERLGRLAPGQTKPVAFFARFKKPGDVTISVTLDVENSNLPLDNTRHAVATVSSAIKVLCVDGEPGSAPDESETAYLRRALKLTKRQVENVIAVTNVQSRDLADENLAEYDVVILANVGNLGTDLGKKLFKFVRRGGGLVVFAGKRIDGDDYNSTLRDGGQLLMPGLIGKPVKCPNPAGWAMGSVRSSHPVAIVAGNVEKNLKPLFDEARFSQVLSVTPDKGAATLLTLAADRDLPLLLEKRIGAGSVLMFTTSADLEWCGLPMHPLYEMLLQQAMTYLTSNPARRQFTVGQNVQIPVEGKEAGNTVALADPRGNVREMKMISRPGLLPACAFDAVEPGFYQVSPGGGKPPLAAAVNIDPRESDTTVLDPKGMADSFQGLKVRTMPAEDELTGPIKESRSGRAISRTLLILAILILLAQSFLARYFTHRMNAGVSDVAGDVRRRDVAAARRA